MKRKRWGIAIGIAGIVLGASSLGYRIYRDGNDDADASKPTTIEHRGVHVILDKDTGRWRWRIDSAPSSYPHEPGFSGFSDEYQGAIDGAIAHINRALDHESDHPLPPRPTLPPMSELLTYPYGPFRIGLFVDDQGAVWWKVFHEGDLVSTGKSTDEKSAMADAEEFANALPPPEAIGAPTRFGVIVNDACDEISVLDLAQWVAAASPRLRDADDTRDAIGDLMAEAFPDCEWPSPESIEVDGVPLATRLLAADTRHNLPAIRSGGMVSVPTVGSPSVWDHAAAMIVGASGAPPHTSDRWAYGGHVVTVAPYPGGGFEWRAWRSGAVGGPPVLEGGGLDREDAAKDARAGIDDLPATLVVAPVVGELNP